jgi:gliding motility-associated-like protein
MKKLKTFWFILFIVFSAFKSHAGSNVTLCLGQDDVICPGQSVTINDCSNIGGNVGGGTPIGPYTVLNIPYANDPFNSGTSVSLSDDAVSSAINISFPFCFFGTTYNQFWIGSNGWISFSPVPAGQLWTTFTSATIPSTSTSVPKNCIMSPWQDWHPGVGGSVRYQVYGTAPFRRLVVSWNAVPMFSCTGNLGTFQIKIFETTNVVETHIQSKPNCTTWAMGTGTHGLHNANGTIGVIIPGRNSTQWTVTTPEGYRFTPGIQWQNTLGQTFPYNGGVLNIATVPPGTTGYFLTGGCGGGTGTAISDTTWLTLATPSVTASSTPDICTQGLGTLTSTPGAGSPQPWTFNWSTINATTQNDTNVVAGTYTVTLTDGNGCTSTATTTVGDTPAQFSATTTQVACAGGGNGTATATMTPPLGTITYQWSDPLNQTTQTATNLSAGTYTCVVTASIGCSGTVTATVTEIPGLTLNLANQTDVTCNSGSDGIATITATQGTTPYTYSWDQSTSTTNSANDLDAGTHILTVVDALGCLETFTVNIDEPDPLAISFITPDSMICPGTLITLNATGTGGSSPYIYTWTEGSNPAGTGSSVTLRPNTSGTIYCLTLTEQCGSPPAQECVTITFPTDITPNVVPDKPRDCVPGEFSFTNTSTNSGEIAVTQYAFSNGAVYNVVGSEDLTATFPSVGLYDVQMTVTSNYGCIYTSYISNIVEVTPLPVADFTVSKNPATWFETNIQTSDASTGNISVWDWQSPGAVSINNAGSSALFSYPEGQVGTYPITLTVTTAEGCSDSITLEIQIVPDIIMYVPNSFTPDDDEHNQTWAINIDGIDFENFQLVVYNRWGELIWESRDASAAWDGTYNGRIVPSGTYIWKLAFKEKDNDGKRFYSGFVNVLR